MSLKYGILGLLIYGPSTGYDINSFFKVSLDFFWEAQTSQIYRELGILEKNGWASSETIVQYGKPNKNMFRITQSGKDEFYKWMRTPFKDDSFSFKSAMLMKLFFAASQDKDITREMLKKFIFDMKESINLMSGINDHIANVVESYPPVEKDSLYWKLTEDFGIRYFNMAIEWAENALAEIDKME